jgi:hypothetical protein
MSAMVTTTDLAWAAGFLEGEGAFWTSRKSKNGKSQIPHIGASQVQLWPLTKLMAMFEGGIHLQPGRGKQQDYYKWTVGGPRAAGLCMTLYVFLSPKRQDEISRAIARWKTRPPHGKYRNFCVNGHPLSGENLVTINHPRMKRGCRICRRAAVRRWQMVNRPTLAQRHSAIPYRSA